MFIHKTFNKSFLVILMEKIGHIPFIHTGKHHPTITHRRTFGEKASDSLTKWMGSWIFISMFVALLVFWIVFNTIWLIFGEAWDKRPFIMLNLILSCLAAIQAPIILMSQNREAQKDRIRAEYDYAVNRKAEREIERIKEQLDRIERKLR